jgi:hypothetical protein
MFHWLNDLNKGGYYLFLCIITIIIAYASNHFLATDELYYASYTEQFTIEQIQSIIATANDTVWHYLGYLLIPVVIIVRVLFTAFCLQIGNLVQEYHWTYKQIYNIVLKADIVFFLSIICNFYYYAFFTPAQTINDLSINFLSILKLKGIENVQSWLILAYNSINLFELFYVILLSVLLKIVFQLSFVKSILFVLLTYCIGNYLYIMVLTFIYLNLS